MFACFDEIYKLHVSFQSTNMQNKNVCMYTTLKLFLACCFYKIENIFGAKNSIFYAYWPNIWIFKILESWSTICFLLCISFDILNIEFWQFFIVKFKILPRHALPRKVRSQDPPRQTSWPASWNIITIVDRYIHMREYASNRSHKRCFFLSFLQ